MSSKMYDDLFHKNAIKDNEEFYTAINLYDFISSHHGEMKFDFIILKKTSRAFKNINVYFMLLFNEKYQQKVLADSVIQSFCSNNCFKNNSVSIYNIRKRHSYIDSISTEYIFSISYKCLDAIFERIEPFHISDDIKDISEIKNHEVIHYYITEKLDAYIPGYNFKTEDIEYETDLVFTEDYNVYQLYHEQDKDNFCFDEEKEEKKNFSKSIKSILNKHNIKPSEETRIILCKCKGKCNYKPKENYILEKIE